MRDHDGGRARPARAELVTADMVRGMRPGSVIVDLAAETGGNCELTSRHRWSVQDGVTIDGDVNLPSEMPFHASLLYANNVANLLSSSCRRAARLDLEDEIIAGARDPRRPDRQRARQGMRSRIAGVRGMS